VSLNVACAKGCGFNVPVSDEMIEEAKRLNVPLTPQHEVCPPDRKDHPTYVFRIEVYRHSPDGERADLLATVGGRTEAPDFVTAFPTITSQVNDQWEQVQKFAHIAEQDLEPETSEES
jgi:hypothetical protein